MRQLVSTLLTCLLLCASAHAAEQEANAVTLTIQNEASKPVRCQFVLAHFVTFDLAPIAGGDGTTIALQRTADGTLTVIRDGRSMATENILCGLDESWAASRQDLDLQGLRDGSRGEIAFACFLADELRCRANRKGI